MRLLLIDANSIVNRAFYGIRHLSTKDGRHTNAIFGFLATLKKINDEVSADGVVCAFDLSGPTFRHEDYAEYKAGRKGMPDELAGQLEPLKAILADMGYHIVTAEGYEADDIIGTLASDFCGSGCGENGGKSQSGNSHCYIATGDRDSLQLVSENVTVLLSTTKRGQPETVVYTPDTVFENYGLTPAQLIDLKGLMGDTSDNIPGVPGVGEKTALELMKTFGSFDTIFEDVESLDIRDAVKKKLIAGKELAYLSRKLGTINCEAPVKHDIEAYRNNPRNDGELLKKLVDLELFSWIEKFELNSAEADILMDEGKPGKKAGKIKVVEAGKLNELIKSAKGSRLDILVTKTDEGGDGASLSLFDEDDNFVLSADGSICETIVDEDSKTAIQKILADKKLEKRVADLKALCNMMPENSADPENVTLDTVLAGYLLNPLASDYSVLRLAAEYGVGTPPFDGELKSGKAAAAFSDLCDKIESELEKHNQTKLLREIEIPLAIVLADMERIGFEIDPEGISEFGKLLGERIDNIQKEVYAQVGYEFNLNSPKQLAVALFEDLKLPPKKKTKTGYSTNAEVLESLREEHPVIEMILDHRTLAKLKSTYCDGLLKVIDSDGRVRSSFNQVETRTGRISSTEPNLQNIPVRQELGRELRRFFKAREGWLLCDADYSQIELRVLAHMSGDETMINAFNDNLDIHTITAAQVFGVPEEMVTSSMRSGAKAVNFGIIYGIGPHSLSKDIGVSYHEAKKYIDGYLYHYKRVGAFMDEMIEAAKQKGYAETLFDRRRPLPELTSSNGISRSFGERVARNMPIQGTAADIIKIAMIRVRNRLKSEGLKSRLILQVHDELIVEAPENEAELAAAILKEEMENAAKLNVPLLVDVNVGKTWYDSKD